MILKDFNPKKITILKDFVAFKWIKDNKLGNSKLIMPDKLFDRGGEGRLGNVYTAKVLCIGKDVRCLKPGNRFLIHEYDKLNQGDPWNKDEVMFCRDVVAQVLLPGKITITSMSREITDKMMDKYEDY